MVDNYCPVNSIKIVKADIVKDENKFNYVQLQGIKEKLLIQYGKFEKNLPITQFQSNGDTPCMGPMDSVSIPAETYEDIFMENEY